MLFRVSDIGFILLSFTITSFFTFLLGWELNLKEKLAIVFGVTTFVALLIISGNLIGA